MAHTNANFSPEQTKELRDVFELFDKDKSGTISVSELSKIFETLQLKLTETQVAAILKKVDKDSDNQLNFSEFLHVMSHQPKATQTEAYLLSAFKKYDKNGDGYITRQELRETMAATGEILTEKELMEMIDAADTDKDGRVNVAEFLKLMS